MAIQYEAYIATSMDPYWILTRLSEDLKLSGPINPPREEGITDDRTWYYCKVPLGLEGLPANTEDYIDVAIGSVTAGSQEYVDSVFDILGITEQGQPSVNIGLYQPDYNQFPITDEEQCAVFYEEGYLQVLRTMGAVLRCVEGDGFLHREDSPYCQFIRKQGEVIIDPTAMTWGEEKKRAVGVPLTVAKIPEIL